MAVIGSTWVARHAGTKLAATAVNSSRVLAVPSTVESRADVSKSNVAIARPGHNDMRTLSEHVDKNLFLRRIPARMFVVLGPLLLALAAVGIYAVIAFSVARRTVEIGLRLALGASARRSSSRCSWGCRAILLTVAMAAC